MNKRYVVRWVNDGSSNSVLIDTETGNEVFYDRMEPEDANLVRDLGPLVDLLNEHAEEIRNLKAEREAVIEGVKLARYLRALGLTDREIASDEGTPFTVEEMEAKLDAPRDVTQEVLGVLRARVLEAEEVGVKDGPDAVLLSIVEKGGPIDPLAASLGIRTTTDELFDGSGNRPFSVPPEEKANEREFLDGHRECERRSSAETAIGGSVVYSFCATSIGWVLNVECSVCGKSRDLSGDL